jgi:DNA (cytosine-5)-methyltransferase 1
LKKNQLTYIDLFSGAGGLSLGFDTAGFKNLLAVEYDEKIANTYKKNFPTHNLLVGDIKNISNDNFSSILNGTGVDVVIGGPPCQGFSMAGRVGRTFVDDPRNKLFKEFVRVVDLVNPKMFMMENVARMATHNHGKTIKEVVQEFSKLGYQVQLKVLQTRNYGIPQSRQRMIMVGTKNDMHFQYPKAEDKIMSVKEAIADLPKLRSGESSNIPNHNAMNHSEQMLAKMSYVPDGGDRTAIPETLRPKSGDARKYIRYNSNKPAVTVTGDNRKIFHYNQNRALTARELARLQTFPDDFIFYGTSGSIQQQIGNAVPPKLAWKIANSIRESLKGI